MTVKIEYLMFKNFFHEFGNDLKINVIMGIRRKLHLRCTLLQLLKWFDLSLLKCSIKTCVVWYYFQSFPRLFLNLILSTFETKSLYTSVNNKTWITLVILCNVWSWFSVISWNAWDFQSFRVLPGGHRNLAKWLIFLGITRNDWFHRLTVTHTHTHTCVCVCVCVRVFVCVCVCEDIKKKYCFGK